MFKKEGPDTSLFITWKGKLYFPRTVRKEGIQCLAQGCSAGQKWTDMELDPGCLSPQVLLPAYMITRAGRHAAPAACLLCARGYRGALSSVMEGQMANRTNCLIPLFAKRLSHTI